MYYLIDFASVKAFNEFEAVISYLPEWEVYIIKNSVHYLLKVSSLDDYDRKLYRIFLEHGFFTEVAEP